MFARGQIVKELEGESLTDAVITEANMTARVAREGGPTRKEKEDEGWRRIMAASPPKTASGSTPRLKTILAARLAAIAGSS